MIHPCITRTRLLFFCVFIGATTLGYSQSPTVEWAHSFGSNYNDLPVAISCDSSGHHYVAGNFTGSSLTFGSATINGFTSGGNNFVTKFDSNGNVIWAKNPVDSSRTTITSLACDAGGNIYITGNFRNPSVRFGNFLLTSADSIDIFIAKLDSSGQVVWAVSAGGDDDDYAASVAVSHNGRICLTGNFTSSNMNFGTHQVINPSNHFAECFVAQYDMNGNALGATNATGSAHSVGTAARFDYNDDIYVAGFYGSTTMQIGNDNLVSNGSNDNFLVKFDQSLNELWARSSGGTDSERPFALCIDANNNVIVTGWFMSSTFYAGILSTPNSGPFSYTDIFIMKYSSNGNEQWVRSFGGDNMDIGDGLIADEYGNFFMTGQFRSSSIVFGNDTLHNSAAGYDDILVVKFDASGNPLWTINSGGSWYDIGNSVDYRNGELYVAGNFSSSSIMLGSTTLFNVATYSSDLFVARIGSLTGMPELQSQNDFSVYPNPSIGYFDLVTDLTTTYSLSVFDATGALILVKKDVNERNVPIDMSNYSSGIYTVLIEHNGIFSARKLIVQK
ncbi:MAG TPA: T9SS type A sorting domain-containing protein [Bacteroidia bacterium]|nr:T9SS type A sorting domain-containing protein [Bacteroidia bacterium]